MGNKIGFKSTIKETFWLIRYMTREMITRFIFFLVFLITLPLKILFPANLKLERVTLQVPEWQTIDDGIPSTIKIVQLSDIHWDIKPTRIESHLFDEVVEKTNQVEPDLILITGDFVERNPDAIEDLAKNWIPKLKSKYGIYAVLGNHDYKHDADKRMELERHGTPFDSSKTTSGSDKIKRELEKAGVKVLTNQTAFPFGTTSFELIGVGDYFSHEFCPEFAFQESKEGQCTNTTRSSSPIRIVMSHNPDTASILAKWNFNLQLSGHTHGGQICLPNGKPVLALVGNALKDYFPSFVSRLMPRPIRRMLYGGVVTNWEWVSGLHKIKRQEPLEGYNMLYVTRGLATHPPLRLFCDPEVTFIELITNKNNDR